MASNKAPSLTFDLFGSHVYAKKEEERERLRDLKDFFLFGGSEKRRNLATSHFFLLSERAASSPLRLKSHANDY